MIDIESKIISYREDTNDYRLCLIREEIEEINQALTKREQIRAEVIDEVLKKISEVIPFLNNDQLTAYFNICDKICDLKEQNK